MAKRTLQKNFRSGLENNIEPAKYFVYEVIIYKLFKDRVELIGNKLYSFKKELHIKKHTKYYKTKDYILMKSIDLLYAPQEYIDNIK